MPSVVRKVISFPARVQNSTASAGVFACAIPGAPTTGGADTAPIDDATFRPDNIPTISQSWERSTRRIELNWEGRRCRGISIAPDSAIAECDISLGGEPGETSRFRVSPGNPLLGIGDSDFAQVTIPDSIPTLDGADNTVVYWDADRTVNAGDTMDFDTVPAWPLRLELWYDDVLPIRSHRRAALVAHAVFLCTPEVPAGPDDDPPLVPESTERALVVCTNGRRRVRVDVDCDFSGDGDSMIFQCFAIGALKENGDSTHDNASAVALPLNPAGDTSLTIGPTTPFYAMIEMDALSRPLLKIALTAQFVAAPDAGNIVTQIHVRAED
jgi:hypothetical protein